MGLDWAAGCRPERRVDEASLTFELPRARCDDDDMVPEWTRVPVARLAYSRKEGEWTLYYADRNHRFQRYWGSGPSPHVVDLLEEIEADPTCIFWG